ncbi:uncharacterized protein LOC119116970 isoform X2 [Syngnathus acus]|uniref:uncharacterized protein LOC119116970 isoform X2 n=1 Tax=Syngnathus acus TaxID=161584 RepID=UPI001885D6F4|nr:uncharacterized protein LOC119116970 isoform X2 [Syngnathus acus]
MNSSACRKQVSTTHTRHPRAEASAKTDDNRSDPAGSVLTKMEDLKSVNISTHPPFKSVIKSIRACQNREEVKLAKATLHVYTRISESILHNDTLLKVAPDQERLRRNVGQLTSKLRHLSATLARRHCPNTANVLHQLTQLQVDDVTFQKRALSQFLEVYNMATVIGSHTLASPTDASP